MSIILYNDLFDLCLVARSGAQCCHYFSACFQASFFLADPAWALDQFFHNSYSIFVRHQKHAVWADSLSELRALVKPHIFSSCSLVVLYFCGLVVSTVVLVRQCCHYFSACFQASFFLPDQFSTILIVFLSGYLTRPENKNKKLHIGPHGHVASRISVNSEMFHIFPGHYNAFLFLGLPGFWLVHSFTRIWPIFGILSSSILNTFLNDQI